VPGIKTEDDTWELRGHRSRVIGVDDEKLQLFAVYTMSGHAGAAGPAASRSQCRARLCVAAICCAGAQAGRPRGSFLCHGILERTNAQKDSTIRREVRFAQHSGEWIVSGPHFQVARRSTRRLTKGASTT